MSSQARALLAVALATVILFGAQFLLPQLEGRRPRRKKRLPPPQHPLLHPHRVKASLHWSGNRGGRAPRKRRNERSSRRRMS